MAGCSFLVLEGVDGVRGNALRCSRGAGEALRCLLLRTAEKALRCFRSPGLCFYCRKTSHREVFLVVRIGSFLGAFLLQKSCTIRDCKMHPRRKTKVFCGV